MTVPWSPIPCESTVNGEQLVGLIVKFGLSMLTWIERIRIGTPPMIEGTVSESGADLGGLRIDMERDADHDDAVVVGAGQRRGDGGEAQRRALERTREVHLSDGVEGVAAGPGGDVRGPDLARRRAARTEPARLVPRFRAAAAIAGLRAVGDPAQGAGESRRHPEVEVAEELVAVITVEPQREAREVARRRDARSPRPGAGGRAAPAPGRAFRSGPSR